MKKQGKGRGLDGLLVLVLFAVFAVCVLSVLLTGAGVYRRITDRDAAACDRRTAAQYLATKIRQGDTLGGVHLAAFDGGGGPADTLFLTEDIDGGTYVTRIYYYDGAIRELFAGADGAFEKADGEQVLEARGLRWAYGPGGIVTATITAADGTETELLLTCRSGEGAAS